MIKYKQGSLLDVTEGIIVHGCNCKGVMGSGVAKQIKEKYPVAYAAYVDKYWQSGLQLGSIITVTMEPSQLVIVHAMTQNGFGKDNRRYVSYTAIMDCMLQVRLLAESTGLEVHMPKIGAGLGGGAWCDIEQILMKTIIDATVWELP